MMPSTTSLRALGGALTFLVGAGCGAASPSASELPSSALDAGSCASERASCPPGKPCSEDAAAAYLGCVEGSVRSLEQAGKPVAAFDRAAVALLDDGLDAAKAERDDLFRIASRLARPALDDLEEVAADDRWDLAARKAAFACAAWYRVGRICPVDAEVARYVGGWRRYHQGKTNELRTVWPASAALHACVASSGDCPEELGALGEKWTILDRAAFDVKLAQTADGCEKLAEAVKLPSSKKLGATKEIAFELVIERCKVAKEETASAPVEGACYYPPGTKKGDKVGFGEAELVPTEKVVMQKAKRTEKKRVLETVAHLRVAGAAPDAKSPPIVVRIEQSAYRVESDMCDRTSDWGPTDVDPRIAAGISSGLLGWIEPKLTVGVDDHAARAAQEKAAGNYAAADHFYVLAALGQMRQGEGSREVPAPVVTWFHDRHGIHGGFPDGTTDPTLVEEPGVGVTYSWPDVRRGGAQAGRVGAR
jgi:hypothetical protein